MSNDNNQLFSEEIAALKRRFLSGGVLVKGTETLIEMKNNVIELDNALNELAKTANLSAEELSTITDKAFQLGDAVGKTGTEILSYLRSTAQAGYDIQDALSLTEEALKMVNLSPTINSADTALEHIQTILDGFGENPSFAATINDALTGISQTGSVDFDTLVAGTSKLAESAADAGLSFEEMLGLLSGAYQSLGDMDKVTSGSPALFSSLKETYGDTKNLYNALEDLSSVWSTFDDPTKDSITASLPENEQKEIFLALMDNWNGVEQAVSSASHSFGMADEANKASLDSITGKTAAFQNQLEELSASIMDSDLLKFFLELGTTGVGALDEIIDKWGAFTTLTAVGAGYLSTKGVG